jgi:hypothetical protein
MESTVLLRSIKNLPGYFEESLSWKRSKGGGVFYYGGKSDLDAGKASYGLVPMISSPYVVNLTLSGAGGINHRIVGTKTFVSSCLSGIPKSTIKTPQRHKATKDIPLFLHGMPRFHGLQSRGLVFQKIHYILCEALRAFCGLRGRNSSNRGGRKGYAEFRKDPFQYNHSCCTELDGLARPEDFCCTTTEKIMATNDANYQNIIRVIRGHDRHKKKLQQRFAFCCTEYHGQQTLKRSRGMPGWIYPIPRKGVST